MLSICLAFFVGAVMAGSGGDIEPSLQVELRCAGEEFLLGQPIRLRVTVTNHGDREVFTWVDDFAWKINLLVASHGKEFECFKYTLAHIYTIPYVESLGPGKSKVYEYRMLYGFFGDFRSGARRLAFDRPGVYTVKALYPVPVREDEKISSNTIQIKILEPRGADAEVWRDINHRPSFLFLQNRNCFHSLDDTPLRIAEILQKYPTSGYRECFREALKEYLQERVKTLGWRALSDWEVQQIRSALGWGEDWVIQQMCRLLGIEELPPEAEAKVRSRWARPAQGEELVTLEELCREMSRQGDRVLRVAPELAEVKLARANAGSTPAEFRRIAEKLVGGTWEYRPGGEWLIPAKAVMPLSGVTEKQQLVVSCRLRKTDEFYLLGEPVEVLVRVRNYGTNNPVTWADESRDQISIQIAREGEAFVDFATEQTAGGLPKREPKVERLDLGSGKAYGFRVLYTFVGKDSAASRSRLAFDGPGEYLLRAVYPVPGPGEQKIHTHPVRITVREPDGVDAEVWREIRHRPILYFLQHRQRLFGELDDTPSHIAEILQKYPASAYCDCLREALQEYYQARRSTMTRQEAVRDLELERIQKVLGISELPAGRIFPADRRLDVKVKLSLPKHASLEKALEEASRASGVTLRLSPELEGLFLIDKYEAEVPLRQFMQYVADAHQWTAQEDGGYLLRAKPKKP